VNIHQSKRSDHDRLGFHPDCPTCRQDRLFAALSPSPALCGRVRVLLAAGVLAFSAGGTATSIASEPDDQQEGIVVPDQGAPAAPPSGGGTGQQGDDLGQNSGGETPLPFEVNPVPGAPPEGTPPDGAPLEAEPVDDSVGRLTLTAPDSPEGLGPGDAPVPPTEAVPPAPPVAPMAPGEPLAPTQDPVPPEAALPPAKPEAAHRANERGRSKRLHHKQPRGETTRAAPAPAAATPAYAPASDLTEQSSSGPAVAAIDASLNGRRFHTVRPGESLWSIASALLGPDASPGAIALEVHRLWRLNSARVGTGDPDLLRIGVKLHLRGR
jgi:hypothetical protein